MIVRSLPRRAALLCSLSVAVVLAACAGFTLPAQQTGETADAVVARWGAPTARYALPDGGSRLEYARGPFGKQTTMIDVDAQGKVTASQQVLTEANSTRVIAGMPAGDLLLQLGRPSHRRAGGLQGGEVWSYRYDAVFCQWFQVSVTEGRVRDTTYGPDPLCDVSHTSR